MVHPSTFTAHAPPPSQHSGWGRVSKTHVVIVILSLVMTLSVWRYSQYQIDTRVQARYETARDTTIALLKDGVLKYEDGLWAGVSAMRSHGNEMTLEQWRTFASSLKIDEKYPGINGIGFITFLNPDEVPEFMARRRAERGAFQMHPPHNSEMTETRMPITFIEPEATNAEAVGLDVSYESNRRIAALASRDLGSAQISGPITLVQANNPNTPGFLFYAPVYAGDTPTTVAERQEQAIGLVYAPFVVHKLMEGLLSKEQRNVRFSISDGGQVIYDEHGISDPLNDPDPLFQQSLTGELYGREWTIDLRTNLAFRADNTYMQPTFVLIGGLIIEALIIGLLVMMTRANANAHAYAERVTKALQREKHRLANTNEELEQFAYVASHDLKTPIRGISGLTDMLREDLEDYLHSDEALPEVAQNLDRIDARVTRMNELTRGILEFSRVGAKDQKSEPLHLSETIQIMAADFGIDPEQISLDAEVQTITADSFNFRRVLENLIGNTIKYHDGVKPLQIDVKVTRIPQRLQIEVSDNGPGIDPQFHQRVFEVFQTLRDAGSPESTGIGLAIVKKLVERQGGAITLQSEVGAGATFRFDWPAKPKKTSSSPLERAA